MENVSPLSPLVTYDHGCPLEKPRTSSLEGIARQAWIVGLCACSSPEDRRQQPFQQPLITMPIRADRS